MLPDTMTALVLPSPGAFEIQRVPVPRYAPDEVLCRVRAVAICGSDPEIIRGGLAGSWPPSYPFIPGHEWAGEIVAVGEQVKHLAVGQRIAAEPHKGCGFCPNCLKGRYTICDNYGRPETGHRHYGFVSQGAYAEYIAVSNKCVTPLPDSVSFQEGALVDTAGVVLHGMELTGITAGGTVAVIGPGPIGLLAVKLARALGAARIIVVGRGHRLQFAKQAGADEIVDMEREDPAARVRELTGGRGVDEAFECSGAPGTIRQCVEMAHKGGRVGLLGVPPGGYLEPMPIKLMVMNEIALFGSRADPNVIAKVVALMGHGQLCVRDMITHVVPLADFARGLEIFTKRLEGVIKVVVEP